MVALPDLMPRRSMAAAFVGVIAKPSPVCTTPFRRRFDHYIGHQQSRIIGKGRTFEKTDAEPGPPRHRL